MNIAQAKLDNAKSELMLAIMSGNEAREMELRRYILDMVDGKDSVPAEPTEVYSPHTIVGDVE